MLEKKMKTSFSNSQPKYLDFLLRKATKSSDAKWTSCLKGGANAALACPTEWASDSNEMNCNTVWPAYDNDSSQNFGETYYDENIEVAEQQIVKAGVRMAAWFDKFVGEQKC